MNTHERGRAASDWHSDRGSAAHDQLHGLQQLGNRWHHSGSPVKEAAMLCEDLPQSNSHLKPRLVQLFLVKWIERLFLCRFHSLSLRMLIVWTPNTARMNLKLCQPSQEHRKLNFYTPTVWKYFLTVLCFVNLVQATSFKHRPTRGNPVLQTMDMLNGCVLCVSYQKGVQYMSDHLQIKCMWADFHVRGRRG